MKGILIDLFRWLGIFNIRALHLGPFHFSLNNPPSIMVGVLKNFPLKNLQDLF